jgi:hypothetical protein
MATPLELALRFAQLAHESTRGQQRDQQVLHALTIRGVGMLLDAGRGQSTTVSARQLLSAAQADVEELRS